MKKVVCIVCIVLFVLSGCMQSQTVAVFRGKRIVVGQSNDSVEKQMGSPDWVAMNFRMQMARHWTGWTYSPQTIEWGYRDSFKSLVLWFEHGTVYVIWLVENSKLQ